MMPTISCDCESTNHLSTVSALSVDEALCSGVGISVMGIFRDKKDGMSFMLVGPRNGRSICGGGTEAVAVAGALRAFEGVE